MKKNIPIITIFTTLLCVFSCERSKSLEEQQWDKIKATKISDLQKDVVKHQLTQEQIIRSNTVQSILSEIDSFTQAQWIDDFSRDDNPESELLIWEEIARVYQIYCNENSIDIETKKEVKTILLYRSAVSEEQAINSIEKLNLNKIDKSTAKKLMKAYKLNPKPIKIRVNN